VGLNHLAFHASSREQVDSVTQQLRERGARILYEDRHPHASGGHAVFFEDPDRIKVELVAN
jgi:catechol 2,3-dioxygenase-like lactoylglutathione lyase family enzyme